MTKISFPAWTLASVLVLLMGLSLLTANTSQAEEPPEQFTTRLFFADADGANLKPVVEFAEYQSQGSPSWSLDGKLIGFDAWKPQKGENFANSRVIVVNADGSNPRKFEDAAMPSFSPDGTQIVFSRPNGRGIWIANVNNPAIEDYINVDQVGWGADWSRDGRIVYGVSTQDGGNLRVAKVVDGQVEEGRVDLFADGQTPYIQIYWNMAWSADGKRIAYKASNRQNKLEFCIVDARGEKFGLVKRDEGDLLASFAWSPDSSHVLFVKKVAEKPFYEVFAANPDQQDPPEALKGLDPYRSYSDVTYSADGKRLLITCSKRQAPPAK